MATSQHDTKCVGFFIKVDVSDIWTFCTYGQRSSISFFVHQDLSSSERQKQSFVFVFCFALIDFKGRVPSSAPADVCNRAPGV